MYILYTALSPEDQALLSESVEPPKYPNKSKSKHMKVKRVGNVTMIFEICDILVKIIDPKTD